MSQSQLKKAPKKGLPWYRYYSVWVLLIIVPLFTLGASIATVYIASTSNLSGGAHESYYKKGLSPNELAPREEQAKQMGLSAEFSVSETAMQVVFNQPLAESDVAGLRIKFQHPTRETLDFALPLAAEDDSRRRFRAEKPDNLRANKWDIFIDPKVDTWRIKGRLLERENQIDLTPFGQ